tara:strand:- start:558 stop:1001 length:444 start_codon:yes stop_codon:yes gene_type:complete
MIVACEKCSKKFSIRDDLIPEEGRLLQCGNCNHKWFYKLSVSNEKKKIIEKIIETSLPEEEKEEKEEIKEIKKKEIKQNNKPKENTKENSNLFKKLIVIIISIIALLVLVDTFKFQIEKYIPGVNLVLNNLYETLKDLFLFAKDLIN